MLRRTNKLPNTPKILFIPRSQRDLQYPVLQAQFIASPGAVPVAPGAPLAK
jgi:hypothetical protein